MICSRCDRAISDASNFCNFCGSRQRSSSFRKRLSRSTRDSKIAGVCGGIAEYLDIDPTLVRVIWVALSVVPGGIIGGGLAYLLAWLIIPKSAETPVATAAPIEQTAKFPT
jgi:phage shock protein C